MNPKIKITPRISIQIDEIFSQLMYGYDSSLEIIQQIEKVALQFDGIVLDSP